MLCTDDCHPDDLIKGYIDVMVKRLLNESYSIFDVLNVSTKNAREHYGLNVGLLQFDDPADFIVVDNLTEFNVLQTIVDGDIVFDVNISNVVMQDNLDNINNFFVNEICKNDIRVPNLFNKYKVIDLVENSLLTNYFITNVEPDIDYIESNVKKDILKIVVLNRYMDAKPAIAFIKGFKIKSGAIATTVSHDSHNIVAVGTNDEDIVNAISKVQDMKGGMVYINGNEISDLPLPVAGLMSDQSCTVVAKKYENITSKVKMNGCTLHAPFMTLSFMSLLVIPKLKLSDQGLFDGEKFEFTDLQISNE
jgi:adenine deaminase